MQTSPLAVGPIEAAKLIGCGRTIIFGLLKNGAIPSFRLGRKRLIRLPDLQAFIDGLARQKRDESARAHSEAVS